MGFPVSFFNLYLMLKKILIPIKMPYWWQDLLFAVPRIVCGYLLTSDFGAAKFGLPWSPVDNNLKFLKWLFGFRMMSQNMVVFSPCFPHSLLGWELSVKLWEVFFYYWDCSQDHFHFLFSLRCLLPYFFSNSIRELGICCRQWESCG